MRQFLLYALLIMMGQFIASDLLSQRKDSLYIQEYTEEFIDTLQKNYRNWEENYIDFQNRLKKKAHKTGFTKELYNLIFVNPGLNPDTLTTDKSRSIDPFLEHHGKTIKNILIFKLEPFGPTIDDFIREPGTFLAKLGNKVQIDTRDYVIRNNLLFKKGDALVPVNLADTERLLRSLDFIRDAKIMVADRGNDDVTIIIISKDNWSLVAGVSHFSNDSNSIRLYDRNVMGTGQMIKHEILVRNNNLGYNGYYKLENIAGSFISGAAGYTGAFGYKDYFIGFDRRLQSRKLKYGGGLLVQHKQTFIVIPETENVAVSYNYQDIWAGRRVCVIPKNKKCPDNIELLWSLRFRNQRFIDRPIVSEGVNLTYHNNQLYLTSIAFAKREYYKARLINYFGISEDVPTGFKIEILTGIEKREFKNRQYAAFGFHTGNYFRFGYYSTKFELGSFFSHRSSDQGVVSFTLNGFGEGHSFGLFRYRPFFRFNYTTGINRWQNEQINLNGLNGINGITGYTDGLQRLVFKHESVLFSMKNFADFHYAFTAFSDFGLIGWEDPMFEQADFYMGIGVGLRINNHNLFFRRIQFRLAYYPVIPPGGSNYIININSPTGFKIDDFIMEKPEIVGFY